MMGMKGEGVGWSIAVLMMRNMFLASIVLTFL